MPLGNIFGLQFIVSQTSSNLFDQACLLDENGNPVLDENGNCILMENGTGALAAPAIDGIPTLGGFEEIGSTLTATAAGVTGEPVPTRTWQWQRSLDGSTSWTPINVRENLFKQSNNFNTTPWTGLTPTSGQTGYDGSSDAWLLTKTSSGAQSVYNYINETGVITMSVYAKAGSVNWMRLTHGGKTAYFDLSGSGAIGVTSNGIDQTITSVGNGWFRCTLTANKTTAGQTPIYPYTAEGDASGSTDSIYIQDAQFELGLVATEYIESGATTGLSSYTTSADYTIQDSDDGHYLRVSQVETNSQGTDTAESIPTAFIATQETLAITNFTSRVEADGGSVESGSCLETDLTFLMNNP